MSAPDFASLQQAAHWYARLQADDATAQDRAGWQQWLDGCHSHREAWRYVETVSERFAAFQNGGVSRPAGEALCFEPGVPLTRRRVLGGLALLGGASVLGWTVARHTPLPSLLAAWSAEYRTAAGEIRELTLSDGTHVWLNTASTLDADYGATLRRLRLHTGEVLIDTAKDARPLVVDTAQGRLRALGTRFSVYRTADAVQLTVFNGAVEIRTTDSGATQVLAAGQQTRFDGTSIRTPAVATESRQSWSRGVLLADDVPLADFVAELSRYRHGYLACAPEIAGLRVMGAFPADDPERALAMLEQALPVVIVRRLPWWVTVEPRPG